MRPANLNTVASYTGNPCITILMNAELQANKPGYRRTELSRLVDQARFLIQEKANVPEGSELLKKLETLPNEIPLDQEGGSISVFLSDGVGEILYSPWPVLQNHVQVAEHFDLRPMIEASNNRCEYELLVLHPKGIKLLHGINDKITGEVKDSHFALTSGPESFSRHEKNKDEALAGQQALFDRLDKELIARFNKTRVRYVIAAGGAMYNSYMANARFQSLYPAHIAYHKSLSQHAMAAAAWAELLEIADKHRRQMVEMVTRLVTQGQAVTSLPAILDAARNGNGDVLVIDKGAQLTEEQEALYCDIIWHVIRHKGKVLLAEAAELGPLGSIALKLCY